MEPLVTTSDQRRDADGGRAAVPEIAELLYLQRPAAAVAAAAVVLVALGIALALPGLLPANLVTGVVVGLFAVVVATVTAVVLDGRDPVLRGPRHLRRDGHTVLARMAGPDPARHGAEVLAAIERRLEGREHLGMVLTGTGTDPSELAVALGRGAAADGHTALVIDLRASGAPGVADVGNGTVRLGEAARLADDRPYAWIGAGADRAAAATAAASVAQRPPRDLKLLLVVAPEATTHAPDLLAACERTVLLVAADTAQRAMVNARLEALERAGARTEAVVVGGVRAAGEEPGPIAPLATWEPDASSGPPRSTSVSVVPRPTPLAPAGTPAAAGTEDTGDTQEPAATVPPEPSPQPTPIPDPEPVPTPEPDPTPPPDPAPPSPTPGPFPEPTPTPGEPGDPGPPVRPDPGPDGTPPVVVPEPEADPAEGGSSGRQDAGTDTTEPTEPTEPADSPERSPWERRPPESRASGSALDDTGPIPPVVFRTATPSGDTQVPGMAQPDELTTVAALEQLAGRQRDWHGQA